MSPTPALNVFTAFQAFLAVDLPPVAQVVAVVERKAIRL